MVPLDRSYNTDYFWSAIVSIDHVDRAIDQQDRQTGAVIHYSHYVYTRVAADYLVLVLTG